VLGIQAAAARLRTTPRMLRYRESLGLLPSERAPGAHRRYDDRALRAAAYAITLERSYDVSPGELAFALRTLTDPAVYEDVRRLSELAGRPLRSPLAALDFDQEKARRLLRRSEARDVRPNVRSENQGPDRGTTVTIGVRPSQ
jgi:MerR family transcriptional regulator, copper efflux regulator